MNNLLLVGLMSLIVYSLRISGFLTQRITIPEMWERTLGFVPIAVLSALAASNLATQGSSEPLRLVAATGAGVIALRTGRMWACIFGGIALYWGLRLIW